MTKIWNKLAVAGLFTLIGCAGGEPTSDGEYLFGLSEAELLSIHPLVAGEHDQASWLAHNKAPFACARYGDLCRMVGAEAAEDITRAALERALGGASLGEVVAEMYRATDEAAAVHEPVDLGRSSDTDSELYPCGNHRIHIETFKVNPPFGARYGQVTCKHQAWLTPVGIPAYWGGTQDAEELEGVVGILGTAIEEDVIQSNVHRVTTSKVFPSANQTVEGACTGTHNGDVVSVFENEF